MNQLSTYSWTFDEDVIRYSEAGYRAIGVWRSKLSDFGEERGMELLRDAELEVSNLMWAGGFTGCDGRSFEESVDDALEAIRLAADLHADCLVVYTGSRSGHTWNHARRLSRRAFERILPEAERSGVTLAVAPAHRACDGEWTFLHDLDDIVQFVTSIDSPWAKFTFDTYQLGHTKLDFDQLESLAPNIAIVHLADARHPPDGEMNCCLLGEGTLPIGRVLSALHNGGFRGFYDVKIRGEDVEHHDYSHLLEHSLAALTQRDQGLAAN